MAYSVVLIKTDGNVSFKERNIADVGIAIEFAKHFTKPSEEANTVNQRIVAFVVHDSEDLTLSAEPDAYRALVISGLLMWIAE